MTERNNLEKPSLVCEERLVFVPLPQKTAGGLSTTKPLSSITGQNHFRSHSATSSTSTAGTSRWFCQECLIGLGERYAPYPSAFWWELDAQHTAHLFPKAQRSADLLGRWLCMIPDGLSAWLQRSCENPLTQSQQDRACTQGFLTQETGTATADSDLQG